MYKAIRAESYDYYYKESLDALFKAESELFYGPNDNMDPANKDPFKPDLDDLVRLHKTVRQRKILTVLEFGVGYSTLVMADALAKNKADYQDDVKDIRCLNPFKLFAVEADGFWAERTRQMLPDDLRPLVEITVSEVHMGTFQDRFCHYYSSLPNISPDFIYLDGPAGHQVKGNIDGSDFAVNIERTVMSGDLLRLEPTFTPGLMILVDGRANNARFLRHNFQRDWKVEENQAEEYTTFELVEPPLGPYNKARLAFQNLL